MTCPGIIELRTFFFATLTFLTLNLSAQFSCPDSTIYQFRASTSQSVIIGWNALSGTPYNPNLMVNVPITDLGLNTTPRGLALLPNLNSGSISPTFYTTQFGQLAFWNGAGWTTTTISLSSYEIVELAGCGSAIYALTKSNILNSYDVVKYTPPNTVTTLTHVTGKVAGGIVTDCSCNFYLLRQGGLEKYDPSGNLIAAFPFIGTPFLVSVVTRFGIIGNKIFVINPSSFLSPIGTGQGTITPNGVITATLSNPGNNGTIAFASCPFAVAGNVSASVNSATLGCNPSVASLSVSTNVSSLNYTWLGPGLVPPVGSGPTVNVNAPGVYSCYVNEGWCADTLAQLVTTVISNSTTVAPSILPGSLLCLSPAMKLTATINPGSYNYQWTGPDITSGQGTPTVTINDTGKYELVVTNPTNGCIGVASTSVLPLPLPELGISSPTLCVYSVYGKDKATLSYNGADTYTLLLNPGFSVSLVPSQPIVLYQTHDPPGITGATSATLIGGNGVCTGSTVTNFSVLPATTLVAITSHTTVCSNSKIQLTVSGAQSYTWYPLEAFDRILNNEVEVTVKNSSSYSVQGLDEFGCHTPVQTFFVDVFPLNSGRIKPHPEICAGQCPELEFEPSNKVPQSVTCTWTVNNQLFENTKIRSCFLHPGTYTLLATLTDTTTSCSNGYEYVLNVRPKPHAAFNFSPLDPVEGQDEVMFVDNTADSVTLNWQWPDPETGKTKSSETGTIQISYLSAGKYPVTLVTTNQWYCADTLVKVVQVEEDFLFYMPNTFTPNDDGRNEIFTAVVHGLTSYKIEIYDRWGSLVFSSGSVESGWDGTFKGQACPEGTYIWKATVNSKKGKIKEYKGHVLLMR